MVVMSVVVMRNLHHYYYCYRRFVWEVVQENLDKYHFVVDKLVLQHHTFVAHHREVMDHLVHYHDGTCYFVVSLCCMT